MHNTTTAALPAFRVTAHQGSPAGPALGAVQALTPHGVIVAKRVLARRHGAVFITVERVR